MKKLRWKILWHSRVCWICSIVPKDCSMLYINLSIPHGRLTVKYWNLQYLYPYYYIYVKEKQPLFEPQFESHDDIFHRFFRQPSLLNSVFTRQGPRLIPRKTYLERKERMKIRGGDHSGLLCTLCPFTYLCRPEHCVRCHSYFQINKFWFILFQLILDSFIPFLVYSY